MPALTPGATRVATATPELGGTADPKNLWPERYASPVWSARVKDQLEDLLPTLVCQGRLDLGTAQRDIAVDWIVAYKKYFHTDRPQKAVADAGLATFGFDGRMSDAGDIVEIVRPPRWFVSPAW